MFWGPWFLAVLSLIENLPSGVLPRWEPCPLEQGAEAQPQEPQHHPSIGKGGTLMGERHAQVVTGSTDDLGGPFRRMILEYTG